MIVESFVAFLQKVMMFTSFVNNNSSFPKPLSEEQEKKLLAKIRDGDSKAKDELLKHNLRLVAYIVKKFNQTEEADDLISVGSLGLLKAINTYKEGLGTQFSTYAARCIENEVLMLIRANKKHKNTISIDDVLCSDEEENDVQVVDLTYVDDDIEDDANKIVVSQKLNKIIKEKLSKREYQIIHMRYGLNNSPALTQREVAVKLGISRSYISRIEKKAIETLSSYIKKEDYY